MIPLRDDAGPRGFAWLTLALVAAWIAIGWAVLRADPQDLAHWIREFGLDAAASQERLAAMRGAPRSAAATHALALALPLLGHALFHGAPLVAVANALAMWICGVRLESRAGPLRYGLFLALVTMAGALAELGFVHDPTPALGASATLAGVIVAYLLFHFGARARVVFPVVVWPVFFEVPVLVLVITWIAVQVPQVGRLLSAPGSRSPGVLAVGAGAAAGLVLAPLLLGRKRVRGRGNR